MSTNPTTPENMMRQAEAAEAGGQLQQALTLALGACASADAPLPVLAGAARIAELVTDRHFNCIRPCIAP